MCVEKMPHTAPASWALSIASQPRRHLAGQHLIHDLPAPQRLGERRRRCPRDRPRLGLGEAEPEPETEAPARRDREPRRGGRGGRRGRGPGRRRSRERREDRPARKRGRRKQHRRTGPRLSCGTPSEKRFERANRPQSSVKADSTVVGRRSSSSSAWNPGAAAPSRLGEMTSPRSASRAPRSGSPTGPRRSCWTTCASSWASRRSSCE